MKSLIFRENAGDMEEREVLQQMLKFTKSNVNSGKLADDLLDAFGNLKNVLEARPEQLQAVPGVGEKTSEFIASLLGIVRIWQRLQMDTPESIANAREAEKYCKRLLSGARLEEFWVICLNARCKVIGKRKIATGSLSEVSAYPRLVMETALNYNAHSIMLSHNHPGGTCAPSTEDIKSTLQIQQLMAGVQILVLDHIIVAGDNTYSMIQHGDIDYRRR